MSPEELDRATADEAWRLWQIQGADHPQPAIIAARLAREGWTPPPVYSDVLAFNEWTVSPDYDSSRQAAYCAGARMARERAQVVSDALVEALDDYGNWDYWDKELRHIIDNYKAGKEAAQ
jgi:hypothetical protein